jgi:hypothetical protein
MLGDGNGNFAAPAQLFAVGTDPDSIAVGDFNNDGKLDAAVANFGEAGLGPASISVLLGNGNGTFQPQTNLPLPANAGAWEVAVADLNGDGTFAPAVFFGANVFPLQIAAGTLEQRGKPGLVLVNNGFLQQPSVAYTVLRNTTK